MIIPETAIIYRQLNALGQTLGVLFSLFNQYVTLQRETHRFRTILNGAGVPSKVSGPVLYGACFIDITINGIISRLLLIPNTVFTLGNYFADFPYIMFSIFAILFVCMDQNIAYQKINGTVYILVINCLSIVLDAASKSLLSELFYLHFGSRMFIPFVLCFSGSLVWRTLLRAFCVAFAQTDAEKAELLGRNFSSDPTRIKINSTFARGLIFSALYSIFRPIFGNVFTQVVCAMSDCCNITLLVIYYMRIGTYEVDDLYTITLQYICGKIQRLVSSKQLSMALPVRS